MLKKISLNIRTILIFIIVLTIVILLDICIFTNWGTMTEDELFLRVTISTDEQQSYQVFYSFKGEWLEKQSVKLWYTGHGEEEELKFPVPKEAADIRLDIGDSDGVTTIHDVRFTCGGKSRQLNMALISGSPVTNMIKSVTQIGNALVVVVDGNDAYFLIDVRNLELEKFVEDAAYRTMLFSRIWICFLLDCIIACLYRFRVHLVLLWRELSGNGRLIIQLAKNDFKTRFAGSYFGVFWAFVQPMVIVLVYWFVFQMFFESSDINNCPFILWLLAGLVPWFFFQEAVIYGTASLIEYNYMVKKVVFNITIIPAVRVISSLFIHIFFITLALFIFVLYGYFPNLYTLQILYYTFCMILLSAGISYLTCSIAVFFRDIGQLINIIMQVGMWVTPIMWKYTMLTESQQSLSKLNPMFYITNGYRNCLINQVWFWEEPDQALFFWFFTVLIFVGGTLVFRKLKSHFANVL